MLAFGQKKKATCPEGGGGAEREGVQSVELGLNAEVRQILEELRICSAQQLLLDTLALLHHGAGNGLPGVKIGG